MIYFEYKDIIFRRKTSKGKEEHIYSIFKRNNKEINVQKSVLRIEYFASRLFVQLFGEAVCVEYSSLHVYNKQLTSWLVRLYDFCYALVVKDC